MIRVLHVFPDDKFFDTISSIFDAIENVDNLYIYYTKNPNYKFKYTTSYHKIKFETNRKKYFSLFKDPSIDIVFYHSFSPSFYKYVVSTDKNKINLCWFWGYDLYNTGIVEINQFMPNSSQIKDFIDKNGSKYERFKFYSKRFVFYVKEKIGIDIRLFIYKNALSRIDYAVTVLPIEYELLSLNKYYKGKRFMERGSFRDFDESMISKTKILSDGNILLGNSASFENNHIDVMKILKTIDLKNKKIVMPISYGNKALRNILIDESDNRYIILESFLEFSEYNKIIMSCSYAIFGSLRQHAIGNVNMCLLNGLKVFLYKDGLTYKQLKKDGYIVYTIDNDLNEFQLINPLTEEQIIYNQNIYRNIMERNGFSVLSKRIREITKLS